MKRTIAGLSVGAVALSGLIAVGTASSQEGPPPHPHAHVTGVVIDENGDPVSYRKCKELANNQALPLNSHHEHIHTGRAGEAQWEAGNAVVPLAPLTPWANCEELIAFFFPE